MLYVFDCVICVPNCVDGHIHGLMYMKNLIARLLHRKLYAWSNAYRKEVNTKVRNYNLRNLDKETNMKVLNLFMSGWQLALLRKRMGRFMVVKSISNWHMHC